MKVSEVIIMVRRFTFAILVIQSIISLFLCIKSHPLLFFFFFLDNCNLHHAFPKREILETPQDLIKIFLTEFTFVL